MTGFLLISVMMVPLARLISSAKEPGRTLVTMTPLADSGLLGDRRRGSPRR